VWAVPTPKAKICGITRLEDAELAVEAGAWALGFILWPGSKRAVAADDAAQIAARVRRRASLVGVFVNASLDEVAGHADAIGLTHVQLHGDEGPSFCAEAGRRTGCKVIKAFSVSSGADLQTAESFRNVDFHLLDAGAPGVRGGTGRTWDWALAPRRRSAVPKILSGGLTAENVAAGIAAVEPYAVDVASGVEVPGSPGIKDPERVRAFLAAAHGAAVGSAA
jgi:phosphoribosylanthranilate isomerase